MNKDLLDIDAWISKVLEKGPQWHPSLGDMKRRVTKLAMLENKFSSMAAENHALQRDLRTLKDAMITKFLNIKEDES